MYSLLGRLSPITRPYVVYTKLTSSWGSCGHDDVDVCKDPDSELEVLVVASNVLRAGDLNVGLWHGDNVNVESVVFKVNRLAARAVKRRWKMNQTTTLVFDDKSTFIILLL